MANVTIDVLQSTRPTVSIRALAGTYGNVTRANVMPLITGMIVYDARTRVSTCAVCNRALNNTDMVYIAKAAHVWLMPDCATVKHAVAWAACTCAQGARPCYDVAQAWADASYDVVQALVETLICV